jgi:hypothetical protein
MSKFIIFVSIISFLILIKSFISLWIISILVETKENKNVKSNF